MALCLVTGGAGFIGSHTVDLLLEKGYEVRILDSLQPRVHPQGKPSFVSTDAEFVHGDVSRREDMTRALQGVSYVFHLAAYQDYMPDFSRFIHTNAESSALLLELTIGDRKRFPVRKVIFASSQAVSGEGIYVCPAWAGNGRMPTIQEQLASGCSPSGPCRRRRFILPAPGRSISSSGGSG